ncbi:hypothetical protein TWF788_005622 [Orbilia oligospora]|uniref:Uncharacterized protein n=1 Tax=Orbilia oligospora TaxID=2813651 RepID=A0A6G1LQJ1_ORBOL|nr:hypothetical protein TWF788_005622 [Orbilia oligospora]KAF3211424.1 hypothetical protein TWF191_010767 [Orbilia oligospora]KAF3221363.1 hypothetical protein TWF679_008053 [Orbilia oligospora]KAF3230484.1 hypothetical protein TWF192_004665 [Orbilia oligospora]
MKMLQLREARRAGERECRCARQWKNGNGETRRGARWMTTGRIQQSTARSMQRFKRKGKGRKVKGDNGPDGTTAVSDSDTEVVNGSRGRLGDDDGDDGGGDGVVVDEMDECVMGVMGRGKGKVKLIKGRGSWSW